MSVYYSGAVQTSRIGAVSTQAGTTAVLELGSAGMATIYATFTLNNPIGTTGFNGLLTLSGFPKTAAMIGSGTIVEARIRTATGGTDIVTGITVGTTGNKDIVLADNSLNSGDVIRLNSVVLSTWGAKIGTNYGGMELSSGVRYGASTRPNLNFTPPRLTDVSWLAKCGFSRTRLPIVWEMLQPVLSSSIANATIRNGYNPALASNGALYQTYRDWITAVLDNHAANGMTCLLDLHNYCRYRDFDYNVDGSVDGFVGSASLQERPFLLGTNVHTAFGPSDNTMYANLMNARGLHRARMDLFWDWDMTNVRDFCTKVRAYGGSIEASCQISFQWNHTPTTNYAAVELQAYNETTYIVNQMKDVIHDYELLNEITYRTEITAVVPAGSGQSKTAYEGSTTMLWMAAVLRGMADAIHDIAASSGLPLRTMLGAVNRDFGFIWFMIDQGVDIDMIGYHVYPWEYNSTLDQDTWYGTGGAVGQLALFNRPISINEFNAGEIYDAAYGNAESDSMTEQGFRSFVKHMKALWSQTTANIEYICIYELLDEPAKPAPENRFGMYYNSTSPKVTAYLTSAFAGAALTTAEQTAITSRASLLTAAEINAMLAGPALDAYTQPYSSTGAVQERIFALAAGATLTQADFNDIWTKIVSYWGVNWNGSGAPHPGLGGYGLMNEPNSMPPVGGIESIGGMDEDFNIWSTFAQGAVNTIRALDTTTPIYVAGNVWSSTENWVSQNPGFPLTGTNLIYEGHIYLDAFSNGHRFDWSTEAALGATTQTGVNRLTPFKTWLEKYNLKGCIGEIGMPTDNDASGNASWQTSFYNTTQLALQNNIEVFSWVGGSSWAYRNYAITHSAGWYQHKTLEPEINGVFDATRNVHRVTLFVDGGGHGLNQANNGVQEVTVRVGSRGNSNAAITLTVASDNGGTFSKTDLTIAAGANKYDTFTFTPGATGRTTNLTFTVTSPSGLEAPPVWTVYSHLDPVTLSSTDLATASKALLAKYSVAKWVVSDAYSDYVDGAACINTDLVRAISDTGYASEMTNAMEMVNFHNTAVNGNLGVSIFATDGSSNEYMSFDAAEKFGLWCRKLRPTSPGWPDPQQRLDRDLGTSQFAVVAYAIVSTTANGPLFYTGSCEGSEHIAVWLENGQARLRLYESASSNTILNGTTPAVNTPYVVSYKSAQGSQALRMQSVNTSSATLALSNGTLFDSMIIGGGVINTWQYGLTSARIYCVLAGVGAPTDSEMAVLEKYASSLSGGSLH